MYILGLNCYSHDASAVLLKDGIPVMLIEEERLSREKHSWKFPKNAIRACLESAKIGIQQVDHFTYFYKPVLEVLGNAGHFLHYFPSSLNLLSGHSGGEELGFFKRIVAQQKVAEELQREFDLPRAPRVEFVEHHLCHAASAFFVSKFDEAAILVIDGRGESTTTLLARGRGNRIEKLRKYKVPQSLGFLYAAVTDYLGFRAFFDEWKVMGMSAYGTDRFVGEFSDVLQLLDDSYRLNLKYFKFHTHGQSLWLSDEFSRVFGPARKNGEDLVQRHFDVAFALQRLLEEAGVRLANQLYELTRLPALCLAGGVALNVLMNKKIIEQSPFEHFFIQPIANDAGTSLGSALFHYHQNLAKPREYVFDAPYFGPEFDNEQIEAALRARGVAYRRSVNITAETASAIAQRKIVGWFQGRMESGPRALGNRSIVVDPTDPDMKDRLNARVKKRESFRPFAPSVLEEKVSDYFTMPKGQLSPYMILAGEVRAEQRARIPAVTHADNTARVHSVSRRANPRYWDLINEFGKISGIPVLLNTSFNENEPIVCTPDDAIGCFLRTEFEVLAIGDFIASRTPRHSPGARSSH